MQKSINKMPVSAIQLQPIALVFLIRKQRLNSGLAKSLIRYCLRFLNDGEKDRFFHEIIAQHHPALSLAGKEVAA